MLWGIALPALLTTPLAAQDAQDPEAAWAATASAIEAVQLTPAGYAAFRSAVDERHVPFAQRHADPAQRQAAPQPPV